MKSSFLMLASLLFLCIFLCSCDVLQSVAPPPEPTAIPTPTRALLTDTPVPTLGAPEYIDAVYCWESHIDEGEYNLIRFFPNGTLVDVFVQPYQDCQEAWEKTKDYLTETSVDKFNHGEYHLSGARIKFTLAQAKTDKVLGEVNGAYEVDRMLLIRQGAEEWEYIKVFGGTP